MTAATMLYSFSIAALIGLAALAIERVVDVAGRPRRTVWIVAMIASLLIPTLMLIGRTPQEVHVSSESMILGVEQVPIANAADTSALDDGAKFRSFHWNLSSRYDTLLNNIWIASSGALLAIGVIGWVRLRRQASRWSVETVDNIPVRVSADTGPAVFGLVRPEIVLPRWLLSAPRKTLSMALAHEQSHVAARDPLLSFGGFLLCACTPWNLPLWLQWQRLRFAIEVDCDRRVVREAADPVEYGESLLEIGLRHSSAPIGVITMIQQQSQLERRLRIVLAAPASKPRLIVAVAALVAVSLASVAAQIEAPPLAAIATTTVPSVVDPIAPSAASLNIAAKDSQATVSSAAPTQKVAANTEQTREPAAQATSPKNSAANALVSIDFVDTSVREVLKQIGELGGQNLVVSSSVQGTMTFRFVEVPWEKALNAVIRHYGLGMRRQGNVIIVGTAAEIAARDAAMLASKTQVADLAPLKNEYLMLKYARANAVAPIVEATSLSARGTLSVDEPSNTLIVQDTPEQLAAVRQLVADLDVPAQPVKSSAAVPVVAATEPVPVVESSPPTPPTPAAAASPALPTFEVKKNPEEKNTIADPATKLKRTRFVPPDVPKPGPGATTVVKVDVVFTVGLNGLVEDAHERDFKTGTWIDAAVNAVRQWEFEPPLKNGVPTTVRNMVRVVMNIPTEALNTAANANP